MSTRSAENYLDELLNSVSTEKKQDESVVRTEVQPEVQPEETVIRNTAKAEAEFIMEFERELAGDDYEDFLKEFEETNILPEDRLEEEDLQMEEDGLHLTEEDALLSMLGGSLDDETEPEAIMMEEPLMEEPILEEPDLSMGSDTEGNDPIDLSQMGEEDLISLLANTEDLSDIGQLFAQNDNNLPVEGEDAFAAFAENEMADHEEDADIIKQGEKPEKKKGFLEKISALLFGKEEEIPEKPERVSLTPDEMPGVVELSDENADILALFEDADRAQSKDEATKGKGKKKDKKEKEKKKKEPKAKAPKKPKEPKPKKEKKPKEKDNTPPLPKGPVVMVCILAISIFVLVFLGTDLIHYSSSLSKAKDLYKSREYTKAAEAIAGITIKEDDMMIYGQITTLAAVHSQISEYEVFMANDRKAEALDSLISAAGRVVINEDNTLTFDCEDEMNMLKNRITRELEDGFDMTYEEALDLYSLTERDRAEYTRELYKIYKRLGISVE